jgi:3-oxoacyl-[acyl-carrier-protein] synthase-3
MGARASEIALERAGLDVQDIDAIIYATITPDYYFPGSGVLMQRELGLAEKSIPAFDIRQQCSGFVYGLAMANDFIRSGSYQKILLVGGEIQSTFLDFNDEGRAVAVLFGDGAGAAVIQSTDSEEQKILSTHLHSDGTYAEKLAVLAPSSHEQKFSNTSQIDENRIGVIMDGRFVFKLALQKFPEVILEALEHNGYSMDDLDMLIPHQANLRIAEAVRQNLGISEEKVYNNIMRYGNTTAASIPIALTEAWEQGKIQKGDLVCLAAFGSGFTWGSCLLRW